MALDIVLALVLAGLVWAVILTAECDEKVERILTVALIVGVLGFIFLTVTGAR